MYIEETKSHTKDKIIIIVLAVIAFSLGCLIILNYSTLTESLTPVKTSANTTTSGSIITTSVPKTNSSTKANSSTTIIKSTTTNTNTTAHVEKRLKVNDLVASSDNVAFTFFDRSACYYSGRTYNYNIEYIATFSVIGYNRYTGDYAVYTFTVRDSGIFTLYGVKYQVSFPTTWSGSYVDTSDVILTQVS